MFATTYVCEKLFSTIKIVKTKFRSRLTDKFLRDQLRLAVILRHFINILGYLASESNEGNNSGEISPGSSTESYPAFAHIGLRENSGKNLNQRYFYTAAAKVACHVHTMRHYCVDKHYFVVKVNLLMLKKIVFFTNKTAALPVDDEFQKLWRSVVVESMDNLKIEEYLEKQGIRSMEDHGPKKATLHKRKKSNQSKKQRDEHLADTLEMYDDK
ncbi:hypothetical protein ANN_01850 [Periplaneta americana]|uniref:HAT C-terminal dimerisation domain-containing protein n=1 Tax=Periplaneta americana TaxID=6978 RepID=A0ABQ8TWA9_PERAM|nr:hypothetical protein ANN_01850 [Periplaneta americana]